VGITRQKVSSRFWNGSMDFFIPGVAPGQECERVYAAFKSHLIRKFRSELSTRRIQSFQYVQNEAVHTTAVGLEEPGGRGTVLTIFFDATRSLYLVCTQYRGAGKHAPITVAERSVQNAIDFENA